MMYTWQWLKRSVRDPSVSHVLSVSRVLSVSHVCLTLIINIKWHVLILNTLIIKWHGFYGLIKFVDQVGQIWYQSQRRPLSTHLMQNLMLGGNFRVMNIIKIDCHIKDFRSSNYIQQRWSNENRNPVLQYCKSVKYNGLMSIICN
jgi:hypothetical protein